jgi:ParB/Sulfiredoxin domain
MVRSQRPMDARVFFRIPRDFYDNYTRYTNVTFGRGLHTVFAFVPLSRLSAASRPSDNAYHVQRMVKVLRSGKKVPPISVFITEDGRFEVMDGNTRTAALKTMKATGKVPAIVAAGHPAQFDRLDRLEKVL